MRKERSLVAPATLPSSPCGSGSRVAVATNASRKQGNGPTLRINSARSSYLPETIPSRTQLQALTLQILHFLNFKETPQINHECQYCRVHSFHRSEAWNVGVFTPLSFYPTRSRDWQRRVESKSKSKSQIVPKVLGGNEIQAARIDLYEICQHN